MATYQSFGDEEKDKTEEDVSAGQGSAPSLGSAPGASVGGQSKPTSSGSGGFTNVKKFLDVNRNKLSGAADTVGSGLTSNVASTSGTLGLGRSSAATGISDAALGGIDNVESQSNQDLLNSGEAERVFTDEGYQGPEGTDLTQADTQSQTSANQADTSLQRTSTEGGSAGAYRDQFGGRALTLAERSAFGQGGQLRSKLAGDRAASTEANQAQRDVQGGLNYTEDIKKVGEDAAAIQKGLATRINSNRDALDLDIKAERDRQNAIRRDDAYKFKNTYQKGSQEYKDLMQRYLDTGDYSEGATSKDFGMISASRAASAEMLRRQKESEYSGDLETSDTLRRYGGSGDNSMTSRAAALAKLAALGGASGVTGLGYKAGGTAAESGIARDTDSQRKRMNAELAATRKRRSQIT